MQGINVIGMALVVVPGVKPSQTKGGVPFVTSKKDGSVVTSIGG